MNKFEIRRVRPEDKEIITDICSRIWEGDDYIPSIFDIWVNDKKGEFTALLYEGKIVGMGKLTYLTDTDVWLEGLRADPQAKLHGVGKAINAYYLKKLKRRKNIRSIRFATYFGNVQSRKLSENAGFRVIHTMSNKYYEIKKREQNRLLRKIVKDKIDRAEVSFTELCDYIEKSKYLKLSKNFLCLSWTAYPYSREMIREFFYDTGQHFVIKRAGKIVGAVLYDTNISNRSYTTISLLETKDLEIAKELFEYVKLESARLGHEQIETKFPTTPFFMEIAQKLEMKSWEQEDDFLIYELQQGD
ncbi:MAG: GNAT family N-acetyltransferase [Candidatus Cloacimonetes bacterium]|nr:GNAT family N-acetyltransferase [Candidatus Cloacimonadota bacterium]